MITVLRSEALESSMNWWERFKEQEREAMGDFEESPKERLANPQPNKAEQEFKAIKVIYNELSGLEGRVRLRVLKYVGEVLGEEP